MTRTDPRPASGHSRILLLARHYAALRGPLLAVALVIVALSGLVAAAPAVFARLAAAEVAQTTLNASTTARYLIAHPAGRILAAPPRDPNAADLGGRTAPAAALYGGWQDQLDELRGGLPEPLRSHVGPAQWTLSYAPTGVGPNPGGNPPSTQTTIATVLDVHPERVARLVAGQWPHGTFGETSIDIAISQRAAATLGADVGTEFGSYRIVGIFEPNDESADYWLLNPGLARTQVIDDGNSPVSTATVAFVGAQQAGTQPIGGGGFTGTVASILVWYPLQLADVSPTDAQLLLAQLGGVVAGPRPAPPPGAANLQPQDMRGVIEEFSLSADLIDPLSDALGRIAAAADVLQIALTGPLLAVLAVLVAALTAVVRRGRAATALQVTRGAGAAAVRWRWAGAGLLAGVPAALLAVVAARLIFGPSAPRGGLLLGAAIGLVPAALLALAPRSVLGADAATAKAAMSTMTTSRAPAETARAARRWRVVAEAAVLLAAAVSTYLLLATGLGPKSAAATSGGSGGSASTGAAAAGGSGASAAGGSGADLLIVAAPALLIAAACVLVLRLYPVPLRVIAAGVRLRRGAVSFVGSLRALRDPVSGIVPAVAILAGVAVAGLSGALVTTIDAGTSTAALTELGAPVRVSVLSGDAITDDRYDDIAALDTVTAAARFSRVAMEPVTIPGRNTKPTVELFLADLAALPRVQRGIAGATPSLPNLQQPSAVDVPGPHASATPDGATTGAPIVAIGSSGLASAGTIVTVGREKTLLAATTDALAGITRSRSFALMDASITAFGAFRPTTMLVAPAPGIDPKQLTASLTAILGQHISVSSVTDTVDRLRSGALATGMRLALYSALIAAAAATIVALLISTLAATATRARLLAIARVLGLTRGQRRALIVWEQAPVVVAALFGGAGLGLGLAVLVHRTVDLAPFTGSRVNPLLAIDWPLMAALFVGFLAVTALAVAVGIVLTRRTTAATAIKLDED